MKDWSDGLPDLEAERLAAIMERAFTERERGWTAGELSNLARQPGVFVVADRDGFGVLRVVADEAEILTVAVEPEAQGRGLGRALVRRMLERAGRAGALSVMLEVARSNAPAIRLYRGAGFHDIAVRHAYFRRADGSREDALVLRAGAAPDPGHV